MVWMLLQHYGHDSAVNSHVTVRILCQYAHRMFSFPTSGLGDGPADGRRRIVDFVGQTGGQPAERRQPLPLGHPGAEAFDPVVTPRRRWGAIGTPRSSM